MLEVRELSKEFDGVTAVDRLSFEVKEGEVVALMGPNGSGKTTVFNLISGLFSPDGGTVYLKGRELPSNSPHQVARMGVGRTFQNIRLFDHLTVMENMLLARKDRSPESPFWGLVRPQAFFDAEQSNKEEASDYIELVGLSKKRQSQVETLSYGQKKLLSLARILKLNPNIMLLDEPVAGIFSDIKIRIKKYINELYKQDTSVLFIEHDYEFVEEIADRVIMLEHGKILAKGAPPEVFKSDKVLKSYFGI